MITVRFWGVRGSIPTPGPTTTQIGGNTSCVEVRAGDKLIILDAGTGLRELGNKLVKEMPIAASMFFSHMHWDHIQGFPFFVPALVSGNRFDLYGGKSLTSTLAETLSGQMNFPNFPLSLDQMAASMVFHEFSDGQVVDLGDGVAVKALSLNHPNGCYGYRIMHGGRNVTYCTDTEHLGEMDSNVLELAENTDLFIYDAQYTPEEYTGQKGNVSRVGWGHSTFVEGTRLAQKAGVKKLVLFHHDPAQDDAAILEKERRARALFKDTDAAREGLEYKI